MKNSHFLLVSNSKANSGGLIDHIWSSISSLKSKLRGSNTRGKITLAFYGVNRVFSFQSNSKGSLIHESLFQKVNLYISTIGFLIAMFGIHRRNTTLFGRLFLGFLVSTCFTTIIVLNLMCTWVVIAAHKPYSSLIKIINKRILMTVGQRIKLLSFIEKLSGREIEFYCYDLFPMNNYKFYQYLYIAGCNYFLLMSLF